jgi:pentatricopeptide repeat protein
MEKKSKGLVKKFVPRWDRPIRWIKNDDHSMSAQLDISTEKRGPQKSTDNYQDITANNSTTVKIQDAIQSERKLETQPKIKSNPNNNSKKSSNDNTTISGAKRKREETVESDPHMSKKPRLQPESKTNDIMEVVVNNHEDNNQKKKRNKRRKKKNPNADQATSKIQRNDNEENNEETEDKAEDKEAEYLIVDEDYAVDPNVEEELPTSKEGIKAFDLIQQAKKDENVMKYNKLISMFGTKKQLGWALKTYQALLQQKIKPTVFTYTNLINACVRCGETEEAQKFLTKMQANKIKANEVTYTALIKGLCQDGQIDEGISKLEDIKKYKIKANIRTYNTILRGCLRCGDLENAKKIFERMKSEKINPDVSAYEYLIKTYCQFLQVDEAWSLIEEMEKRKLEPSPPSYSAIATSAALKGDQGTAIKAIQKAKETINAAIEKANSLQGKVKNSVPLFLKMRNEEVERECGRVEAYLNKVIIPPQYTFPDQMVAFLPQKPVSSMISFRNCFPKPNQPIKMEICSGHGDWIVERAKNDPHSNWVGLEIRHERVYQIWSKMRFEQLDNLMIIGGEAHATFKSCIPDECLQEAYVNYPDPPVWEHSKQRLLNAQFLTQINRALKPDQALVVVTDDEGYGKSVIKEFESLTDIFESAFGSEKCLSKVPDGYGSSYFDRFWTNGKKTKRWFMKYTKQ